MTSASTYLIDATGADPVLVPAEVNIRVIAYMPMFILLTWASTFI